MAIEATDETSERRVALLLLMQSKSWSQTNMRISSGLSKMRDS